MAIEQSTRTQLACKIIDLRSASDLEACLERRSKPRPAQECDTNEETTALPVWTIVQQRRLPVESKLSIYFREFEILASLSHPNIIALEKVFVTDNTMYIFQDLVTAGDLFSYLNSKDNNLTEVEAAVIIRQIVIAIQFLHSKNIVHRDLKPENIMMSGLVTGAKIVLTDFGSARRIAPCQRLSTMAGTVQYGAPEMFHKTSRFFPGKKLNGYTFAVDLWSLGVVSALLLLGSLPFDDFPGQHNSMLASKGDLSKIEGSPRWSKMGELPKNFVRRLLILDETDRMTANEALDHVWFSNDAHKAGFESLYQRTIKDWQPRRPSMPLVEFVKGKSLSVRHFPCSQRILEASQVRLPGRNRAPNTPIDPPYKPFPRRMHENNGLWPKRPRFEGMSQEVQEAIQENWLTNSPRQDELKIERRSLSTFEFTTPRTPTLARSDARLGDSVGSSSKATSLRSSSNQRVEKYRLTSAKTASNTSRKIKNGALKSGSAPKQSERPISSCSSNGDDDDESEGEDLLASMGKLIRGIGNFLPSARQVKTADSNTVSETIESASSPKPVALNVRSRTKLSMKRDSQGGRKPIPSTSKRNHGGSLYDFEESLKDADRVGYGSNGRSPRALKTRQHGESLNQSDEVFAHSAHLMMIEEDIEEYD